MNGGLAADERMLHPDSTRSAKPHFEVLDGLRGSAALLVVLFHIQGIPVDFAAGKVILHHAPLMVDFFFALSGFVIGYAYDERWPGMSVARFAGLRLVRLHPLVVLGALLGFASYLLDPFAGARQDASLGRVAAALALMLLALPARPLPNRWDDTHTLNGPAWTLFWEYVGNLAYALVLRRLPARGLAVCMAAGAAALLWTGLARGSLDGGWGWDNLWMAPVRLAFPFCTGLWLFRVRARLPRLRLGWLPLTAVLLAVAAAPVLPAAGLQWNGLFEVAAVLLLFPAVIVLGAHSRAGPGLTALCRLFGRLSFPLYITHFPFIYVYSNYVHSGPGAGAVAAAAASALLLVLAVAWAAWRLWDVPIRAALARRLSAAAPARP